MHLKWRKKNKNTQKEIDKKEKKIRENVANKQNFMNCNKK